MANYAALDFRLMLIDKRALLLRMAFVTDFISRSAGAKLLWPERSMGAVAVVALDETLVNAMVEWSSELGTNLHVAAVAQRGWFPREHELRLFGEMRGMAIDAADAVRQVG